MIDRWIEGRNEFVPAHKDRLSYGRFTWWVQGWGLDGLGPWSDGTDFTYGIPELGEPAGVATATRPVFSWSKVPGAEWYQIWLGLNGERYFKTWITETAWVPEWDLPAGRYTWYIQAWNPDGRSPWSEEGAFLISVSK